MSFPIAFLSGSNLLWAGLVFGFVFGVLLHRGGVADYDVIINQFRFRDFTVLKIMMTAIVVGGIGVAVLHWKGGANFHLKPATMLAVVLGAVLFGVGMVLYGYCPGTGVAAIATGRVDALAGFAGMLVGAAAYALCYPWIAAHILPVADLGKKRLPDLFTLPEWIWYAGLVAMTAAVFVAVSRLERIRSKVAGS